MTPDTGRTYEAMISTLANLHIIDYAVIGLGDYGRPGNYFTRQVERWTRQYRASETRPIEEAERLMEWLPRTIPEQTRTSIVHGDYRLDNLMFAPKAATDSRRVGLGAVHLGRSACRLELHADAMGHARRRPQRPFQGLDLGGAGRSEPGGSHGALLPTDRPAQGCPRRSHWYFAYNLFRLVCILQGIAGRVRDGTAASPQAVEMAARAPQLADAARRFAQRAGA